MAMAKRIFLFIATNMLIVFTISIVLNVLGVGPYLTARGIDYASLAAFCLIWGFAGAFISLGLSRIMAKMTMGIQLVDAQTQNPEERWLYDTVQNLARSAGLPMPEVGIYGSEEVNAFATGPTKSRALVAVSVGLLRRMNKTQVEGVLGHEIAHIANGDMVTMTLLQGIVNAFVMFLARVIAFFLSQSSQNEDRRGASNFMTVFLLEMVLSFFGMIVVAYFSRQREFRADKGGARLAGREKMIDALIALRRNSEMVDTQHESLAAFKINGRRGKFMALFSTHPDLEDRIARLQMAG